MNNQPIQFQDLIHRYRIKTYHFGRGIGTQINVAGIVPHMYGQLIFDKDAKRIHCTVEDKKL